VISLDESRLREVRLFFTLIVVIAYGGLVARAEDVTPQSLSRTGYFDLASRMPREDAELVFSRAFAARPEGLYFLMSPRGSYLAEAILQTDLAGKVKQLIHLSSPVMDNWLNVDDLGQMYVWRQRRREGGGVSSSVYVYGADGKLLDTVESHEKFIRVSLVNRRVAGITYPDGIVEDFADGEPLAVLSGPALDSVKTASFIGGIQALTEASVIGTIPDANTIYTVDLSTGNVDTTRVEAPEIAHAWAVAYRGNPKGSMVIGSFAIDERRKIYLLITGQPIGAAVVLQVDSTGSVERSFRCPLAVVDVLRTSATPDGTMFPGLIGSAAHTLFIVDQRGHVASCAIVP
jgi:hypothetical protein